jgi:hypothetical protein
MLAVGCVLLAASAGAHAGAAPGRVVDVAMESTALANNLVGVATHRALWIPGGRIEADLIPFIARYVEGAAPARR